ncbi:MAG TPA: FtsX-like permease family protein [Gemmatimonadaceae bacterium]|nr:FtsX-like permease family protein [Gemmatimonadaceae bacterium]
MASVSSPLRLVRRNPAFFALATGTLGLALALATTMFAALDAAHHPFVPYPQPERAFTIVLHGGPSSGAPPRLRAAEYDMLRSARSFSVAAVGLHQNTIADAGGNARTVYAASATPNLFGVLGVRPRLGRDFAGDPDGTESGVIVSDGIWRALLHEPRSLRDVTIALNGTMYQVIGVMPAGVRYPYDVDMWMPASMSAPGTPELPYPWLVARLRHGATLDEARGELAALARRLTASVGRSDLPYWYTTWDLRPDALQVDDHHMLAASAVIVLLIACANAGTLVSVRGIARRRELSVRAALGASRRDLVRHQLAECAAIAFGAGGVGLVGGRWGTDLVRAAMPVSITDGVFLPPHLTWQVYAFVLAATSASLVAFGLLPALRASRVDPAEPLKGDASLALVGRRGMHGLVAGEIALALVVLFAAGLMWRTADTIGRFDFGYDARGLFDLSVGLAPAALPNGTTVDDAFRTLVDRASRVAGVRAGAQLSMDEPAHDQILGEDGAEATRTLFARFYIDASPNLLRALGIAVVAGRDFQDGDAASAGVAIVDERAAAALWPNERAVGRQLALGNQGSGAPWIPVVGVARNAALFFEPDPNLEPVPIVYVVRAHGAGPYRQIVIRAGANGGPVATAVTRVVESTPGLRHFQSPTPWLDRYDRITAADRFIALVFAVYGLSALVLSTVGLYTVLAYSVGRRRHEFGVRIALGARPGDLRRMVIREAVIMGLAGIGSGALVALWASRLLDSALYGIPHLDAVSLVGAEALLLGLMLVACLAPAERAARAEPLEVLRTS